MRDRGGVVEIYNMNLFKMMNDNMKWFDWKG